MADRRPGETIMYERTPVAGPYDEGFLEGFDQARQIITGVRGIRAQKQIAPKDTLKLCIDGDLTKELLPIIGKAANISEFLKSIEGASVSFIVGTIKCSVPLEGLVDTQQEKARILADLEHQRKFLAGVRAKLGNPGFVSHAPQSVIETERKKETDALARIEALEQSLNSL